MHKNKDRATFPGGAVVRTLASKAGGMGLIPGLGITSYGKVKRTFWLTQIDKRG